MSGHNTNMPDNSGNWFHALRAAQIGIEWFIAVIGGAVAVTVMHARVIYRISSNEQSIRTAHRRIDEMIARVERAGIVTNELLTSIRAELNDQLKELFKITRETDRRVASIEGTLKGSVKP